MITSSCFGFICLSFAFQLLPADKVQSALETIYRMNVRGFADGRLGAVNGMRPSGYKDRTCVQSDEVWTGVTYALAALLIQQVSVFLPCARLKL